MSKTSAKDVKRAADRLARTCAARVPLRHELLQNPATIFCLPGSADSQAIEDLTRRLERIN